MSLTYATFKLYVELPKLSSDGAKAKAAVTLKKDLQDKSFTEPWPKAIVKKLDAYLA